MEMWFGLDEAKMDDHEKIGMNARNIFFLD